MDQPRVAVYDPPMKLPMFRYQPAEWRLLRVLGSYSFLMLAGLTSIGIAAESLFVAELGATKMAYGIIVGQALVIPVFRLYGWLRSRLRARVISPVVITSLVMGLSLIFLWEQRDSLPATVALFVFAPSLAGLVGGEYGRLSAGLMNPRLARRLFPSIGSLGGFGATFGAFISAEVSARFGVEWLLPFGAALILSTLAPAWLAARGQRPSPRRRKSTKTRLSSNRYALLIALSVGAIAAIATILRFQLGAAALETHGEEGIGVFYSRLSVIINVCSIAFTLVLTRLTVARLGAANSLLMYPIFLLVLAGSAIAVPTLLLIAIAASGERLVRQNVHRTVAALVAMPLHVRMRTRLALVSSGTARPIGTIAASLAILCLTGEVAASPWVLAWPSFSILTMSLAAIVAGCLFYVRNRYVGELVGSLHARRLQLDSDEAAAIALDPDVKRMLLGYLNSTLDERSSLALALLENDVDDDIIAAIEDRWPLWNAALRGQAMGVLARHPESAGQTLAKLAAEDASDTVQAAAAGLLARDWDDSQLREKIADSRGLTRAELILAFIQRNGSVAMKDLMQQLAASTEADDRLTAANVVASLEEDTFDNFIPMLLADAPQRLLTVIAARPNAELAPQVVRWLGGDDTAAAAKKALLAMQGGAIDSLLGACAESRLAPAAIDTLVAITEPRARTELVALLEQDDANLQLRVLNALAVADEALTGTAQTAVTAALDRALSAAAGWRACANDSADLQKIVAENEQQFALEVVFAALDAIHTSIPFRRLYLATQSHDARQRALAAETLDEYLPRRHKRQVLDLLEDGSAPAAATRDPCWQQWLGILNGDTLLGAKLRAVLACGLFPDFRFRELLALAEFQCKENEPVLRLRDGEATNIEGLLLTGDSGEPRGNDVTIALRAIYSVIVENPRCGGLWLRGLAQRVPEPSDGAIEVTRSEQLSLATKTLSDDQEAASDTDIWQRVFFLRTMAMTQGLPSNRLRLLAEISRTVAADAGETIINEGRLGNHFYMVCSGSLAVSGKGTSMTTLGPSDAFGALSLMRGARRSFSVVAGEKSELLTIDRVDFLDLIDAHPSLVRSFARTLALRIKAARDLHLDASAK